MATSVVPALIDALVTRTRAALPAVEIYDGFGLSGDPGDFLMIGVDDPTSDDAATTAESQQAWATMGPGAKRDETGDLTCVAFSWTGDADQKSARDAAYAMTAALENLLRADPTVGLGPTVQAQFGMNQKLQQDQDGSGAWALVTFDIHFDARI